jgi:AcrR family transcriptional regulator
MPRGKPSKTAAKNILTAALEVFAEKGFVGATMDEIAARAGVNKALLYYHVGDKQTLFSQAVLDALAPVQQAASEVAELRGPAATRLITLQAAFARVFTTHPHLPRLVLRMLVTELEHIPAEVLQVMARIFGVTHRLVTEGVAAGSLKPANPALVHLSLIGTLGLAWEAGKLLDRLKQLGLVEEPLPALPRESLAAELSQILLYGIAKEGSQS